MFKIKSIELRKGDVFVFSPEPNASLCIVISTFQVGGASFSYIVENRISPKKANYHSNPEVYILNNVYDRARKELLTILNTKPTKYEVTYFSGLQETTASKPIIKVKVEAENNTSERDIILMGLDKVAVYPKSYHAKVKRIED